MVKGKGVKEMKKDLDLYGLAQDTILSLTKDTNFRHHTGFRIYVGNYNDNEIAIYVGNVCCIFYYSKEHAESKFNNQLTKQDFENYRKGVINKYGKEN